METETFFKKLQEIVDIEDSETFNFLLKKIITGENEVAVQVVNEAFIEAFTLARLSHEVPDFEGDRKRRLLQDKINHKRMVKIFEQDEEEIIKKGYKIILRRAELIKKVRDEKVPLGDEPSSDYTTLKGAGFVTKTLFFDTMKITWDSNLFDDDGNPDLTRIPWIENMAFPVPPARNRHQIGYFGYSDNNFGEWRGKMEQFIATGTYQSSIRRGAYDSI